MSKKERRAYKRGIIDTIETILALAFYSWFFMECLMRLVR